MMFPFNVRVYGVLIEDHKILISHEQIGDFHMTKFPGGGLEFGEGTIDCLKREFKEELDLDIEIDKHLYTTDFFQASAFNKKHQILSIYYQVKRTSSKEIIINQEEDRVKSIEWKDLNDSILKELSFPIDQYLIKKLIHENY